jgi:hypothetical protein
MPKLLKNMSIDNHELKNADRLTQQREAEMPEGE